MLWVDIKIQAFCCFQSFGNRFLENRATEIAILSSQDFSPPTHCSTSVPVVKMIHHDCDR